MTSSRARRSDTRLVILPPAQQSAPSNLQNSVIDTYEYERLLAEMQRFRGAIYAADGAISKADLTADGRHVSPADANSWHVISLAPDGRIAACLRYIDEKSARQFGELFVKHTAAASSSSFRAAVEEQMKQAALAGLGFGEVGGWAVAEEYRCTIEPIRIILATYALLELLGGCVGLATATFRHGSCCILQRLGLMPFRIEGEGMKPYFDPCYDCEMEMLEFDSRRPNPKYREWVADYARELSIAPVFCSPSTHVEIELPVAA